MEFLGEEYGETNPFLYLVSHGDAELIEAVRKGRKAEFAAFHNEGEAPDPQAEETFEQSRLQWQLLEQEGHQLHFRFYQQLIALRKQMPALSYLERKNSKVTVLEKKETVVLERWHSDQRLVLIMNFSMEKQLITMPSSSIVWSKVLCSADKEWQGSTDSVSSVEGNSLLAMAPESASLYLTAYV